MDPILHDNRSVWRDAVIDHYTDHQKYLWANMKAFVAAFNTEFLPVAEAEEAMVKLEGHTYILPEGQQVH